MTNDKCQMTNGEGANGEDVSRAVAEILASASAEIASKGAVCQASGRCCRFEQYGHRLYVTAAELLHFAQTHCSSPQGRHAIENRKSKIENQISLPQFFAGNPEGCPYQVDNLCTAREARPLGCRIYFCDESARGWENELYEKYHRMLSAVHERFSLPYRYLEWRAALGELTEPQTR